MKNTRDMDLASTKDMLQPFIRRPSGASDHRRSPSHLRRRQRICSNTRDYRGVGRLNSGPFNILKGWAFTFSVIAFGSFGRGGRCALAPGEIVLLEVKSSPLSPEHSISRTQSQRLGRARAGLAGLFRSRFECTWRLSIRAAHRSL